MKIVFVNELTSNINSYVIQIYGIGLKYCYLFKKLVCVSFIIRTENPIGNIGSMRFLILRS